MYFSRPTQSEDIKKLAQFKLLGLVQILHKVKIGDLQKGMKNSTGDLWIAEVNAQIQKLTKKPNGMSKTHLETMQFIKDKVTNARVKSGKKIATGTEEQILREK